jgi:hypothetical protein
MLVKEELHPCTRGERSQRFCSRCSKLTLLGAIFIDLILEVRVVVDGRLEPRRQIRSVRTDCDPGHDG